MGRLETTFSERRREGKRVLVAYLTVGHPTVDESKEIALACVAAGADVLELGVPFSDASADGPTIARASLKAIREGGSLTSALAVARAIREVSEAPLVLFGYYNPLFVRGLKKTVDDVADAGIDGLLVVDLPTGEEREFRDHAQSRDVALVPLLAPTSSKARVAEVREASRTHAAAFVYYVSVTGVTGSAAAPLTEASAAASELRDAIGLPTVVGFGIDSAEKARMAATSADGIVVGTALVKRVEEGRSLAERKTSVTALVRELREAIDSMPPLR